MIGESTVAAVYTEGSVRLCGSADAFASSSQKMRDCPTNRYDREGSLLLFWHHGSSHTESHIFRCQDADQDKQIHHSMVAPFKAISKLQPKGRLHRDIALFIAGFGASWLLLSHASLFSSCSKESQSLLLQHSYSQIQTTPVGFHPIHVCYGKMNHLLDLIPKTWWLKHSPTHKAGKKWFSQHGQDLAVAKALNIKKHGYFVDLAANDAVWASNTFGLEQNFKWNGICIEGNPIYWYRLSFRNCHVVGGLVGGNKDGEEVNVTLSNRKEVGPFGGLVGDQFDNQKVRPEFLERRYTVSLVTILRTFHAPKVIDYLSLDVEGAETFIMKDFAWDEYTFQCLTIERPSDELRAILIKAGYIHTLDIARGDTLWMHKSVYESGKANLQVHPEEIKSLSPKRVHTLG
jgi:dTDP-4-dehydrorhamnose 3,5-epimerase-like enzyme